MVTAATRRIRRIRRPLPAGSLFDAVTAIGDYPSKSGPFPMKFTGDILIPAPREAVFAKVRDAKFFASCVEGVQELNEIDPDHYTAVLETKVAYLKFRFNVTVEVTRMDAPR